MGYHRAGFNIVGIDREPKRHYPFPFIQADALNPPVDLAAFDAIHASPPCQAHSVTTGYLGDRGHADLIPATRDLLQATGLPYIIENVPGANTLAPDVMLCGTMFGLLVRRHRYFETSGVGFSLVPPCQHKDADLAFAKANPQLEQPHSEWAYSEAMGIDWGTARENRQAIPPAYAEYLGRQLMEQL
jgi:DNA (cytosine-5)-methyltransferase 1